MRRRATGPLRRCVVIAHDNVGRRFDRYSETAGYNAAINGRQFRARAWAVTDDAAWRTWRYPDLTYATTLDLEVGGVRFELHHAKGETDDHTWVHIPSEAAVLCGDLFIWVCPNAGNPQKVQRYPREWAQALREIIAAQPEVLVPAHNPSELQDLSRDPYLRTTEPLRSLFHRGAVVAEAEDDRAFYDHMNHLLRADGRGIGDAVFLRTINKSRIPALVGKLRRLGVPAAAIVDFDGLRDGVLEAKACRALGISDDLRDQFRNTRDRIAQALGPRAKFNPKSLSEASEPDRTAIEGLLNDLARFGVFIVPGGGLESWFDGRLEECAKTQVFERGVELTERGDVRPGQSDVWAFLDAIEGWIANPNRDGMKVVVEGRRPARRDREGPVD